MTTKGDKARAPEYVIRALAEAVRRLEALTDDENRSCVIDGTVTGSHLGVDGRQTVKEAVRPYVTTWITPDVERALRWAKGEELSNWDRRK